MPCSGDPPRGMGQLRFPWLARDPQKMQSVDPLPSHWEEQSSDEGLLGGGAGGADPHLEANEAPAGARWAPLGEEGQVPPAGRSPRLHCSCLTAGGFHGNESQTRALVFLLTSLRSGPPSLRPLSPRSVSEPSSGGGLAGAAQGGQSSLAGGDGPGLCARPSAGTGAPCQAASPRPPGPTWVCSRTGGCLRPQRLCLNTKVPSGPRCRQQEGSCR